MNNKVNYTVVGLLVLFGVALMLGFTYWLLKPSVENETAKYIIRFDESILGLNTDAAVKYRGISVGTVTNLRINPKNTEQVEVQITILKTTPIKELTVAKLTAQGITGLSYINLNLGDNNAPNLKVLEGEEYPIIKTEASFFKRIETTLGSVTDEFSSTLSATQKLLNDKNQEQIAQLLRHSASTMGKLDKLFGETNRVKISAVLAQTQEFSSRMNRLLDDGAILQLHATINNINNATTKFDEMMPRIDNFIDKSISWENNISHSFNSIMVSYLGIRSSMDEIKRAISSGEFNVKDIAGDIVPTMNNTFIEMQTLMINLGNALQKYERSPNDILFKQEEIRKGPGER